MNRLASIISDTLINSKWSGTLFRGTALCATVGFFSLLIAQRTHSPLLTSLGLLLAAPFLLIYGGALVLVIVAVAGFWLLLVFYGLFGPSRRDDNER